MKVAAPDGAVISIVVEGAGPPLMMVTGTGDDHTRYGRIAVSLAQRFTLYRVDRRGRCASRDGNGDYAIAREADDMLAVIDAIHATAGKVKLLAHSHGAVVCLEAAARTDKLAALLLYEPPMPYYERIEGKDPRQELITGMVERANAGDYDAVMIRYLREFLGTPMEAVERHRANPRAWARWRSMAPSVTRELTAIRGYEFDAARFTHLKVPLRILVGSTSRPAMLRTAQRIQAAVPQASIVELPGQAHAAMTAAPEMFATAVLAFFNGAN